GKILTLLIVATLLAVIGAWIVARRYRASMQHLMKIPLNSASTAAAVAESVPESPPRAGLPAPLTLDDNRRAYRRLLFSFIALSVLIALTRTLIMQLIADGPITLKTVATLGAAYAWPVLPVIAVINRWTRLRFLGVMFGWFWLAVLLLSWRTTEAVTFAQIFQWMLFDIGLPLIVVAALCLGGATRAVGPWLAPLFILLSASSQLGVDLLGALVEADSPLIHWLASWLGATWAIALFALLPWLFAWWPARALGRWLAQAYRQRRISELFYLFTAVWTIALIGPALGAIGDLGWGAVACFLPLLWIPLGGKLMQRGATPASPTRPPTLLVLRVFQQDANVQNLFDRVIERWRLSGNTVLIAGTDLVDRTIDAEDIFTFIDGRLGERFIHTPADLARHIANFELQPDIEGRYRVNECYCHDNTWQQALDRLVGLSDVVLMDLRNFQEKNAGCLHELGILASAPELARVVIITNEHTELPAAQAATSTATSGRFVWLSQQTATPLATEEVLAALFPPR
ncbi:MAG TPA: hypothetical protein VLA64_16075, partial [Azonexus sp.]|nr:hypothetical protein [Azonexus sp.]